MAVETQEGHSPKARISQLEQAFKLRYAGLGFIWVWIYGSFETYAVYPDRAGIGINADPTWVLSATAVVITLFASGIAFSCRFPRQPARWGYSAAVLALAGTVLTALPFSNAPLSPFAFMGGLASGVGTGMLMVLWGSALAQLKMDQVEMAVPFSSAIMFACALVLPYLPPAIGVAATASLPFIAALMLALTFREEGHRPTPKPEEELPPFRQMEARRPIRASLRTAFILFICYGVVGCAGVLHSESDSLFALFGLDLPVLLGAVFGIVLMVFFILFSVHMNFDSLFRWMAPLLTLFLALMPWSNFLCMFLSTTIVSISDTALQIALVLFAVKLAKRAVLPAPAAIGLLQGALQLGVLAGNVAGLCLQPWAATAPQALFVVALTLACVLALSWVAFPTDRELRTNVAAPSVLRPMATGSTATNNLSCFTADAPLLDKQGTDSPSHEPYGEETYVRLARECGLSARETEILGYLARGRSQPYIREELVLSKNTVATHVKHIYQKLNVHSRQELIDLIESTNPTPGA